ncbi:YdiU family protein [Meridianimarinicoccus roseus]|uniref:Protein nucleotidyltransferase YdiU n=1 Tax=Meridianimarinicoccus roseus TaxID=2072018 RepID=A0A2V2LJ44_9RHOB|nr:YdiU family protein [Meridianimarinicoccus roseus]PWR03216.1 YdiU family protein [Meridianimarinicoccus roseus]
MTLHIPFDNSYARLPARLFHRQTAEPVSAPTPIVVNGALAAELGLDAAALAGPEGTAVLAGNAVPGGADPLAQVYAGHQFGGWNPQLGDGRALLLGEVIDTAGRRRDLQLKGSGRTPFSRMGDGRAWLGPVLREYVVSEAMHAMGIPTTRALAAVATGEPVLRETGPMPGAVLTRVAASHIRVGTFQFFAARGDLEAVRALTEYAIARHYPQAEDAAGLLEAVIAAQADLVARWLGVGFIHGVMNTDNCAISGETIDYGPCAFMDRYEAGKVFSSIDRFGRYAYDRQPDIAVWNLAQFATCLLPLIDADQDRAVDRATEAVHRFPALFAARRLAVFREKLGLTDIGTPDEDGALIDDLLEAMEAGGADFTNTFAGLADGIARAAFADSAPFEALAPRLAARHAAQGGPDRDAMARANPRLIPRNHQIEAMIAAAVAGDFAPFRRLNEALANPFAATPADLAAPPAPHEEVAATFCGT